MSYPTLTEHKRAKVARMEAAVRALSAELADYAVEHGGRFILFGSAARGELRHDSDVDIMVDFPASTDWGPLFFAEDRAWAQGLKPDLHLLKMSGERLRGRVAAEGRVLDGSTMIAREHPEGGREVRDARWIDVLQDCESAARHFRAGARKFQEIGGSGAEELDRVMALLHYMQSGHTSLEAALLRILQILDETPPGGSDWHSRLITRCATPLPGSRSAILLPEIATDAQETRAFRHLAMHSYDMDFDPEKGQRAIEAGLRLAEELSDRIETFAREVDPG